MKRTKGQANKIILSFLAELRNSHPEQTKIFTQGSCLNLFCMLRVLFPDAKCYYNENHVITRIEDKYYDINGLITNPTGFFPFTELYSKRRTSRVFNQMYQATHQIIKEELQTKKPIINESN